MQLQLEAVVVVGVYVGGVKPALVRVVGRQSNRGQYHVYEFI